MNNKQKQSGVALLLFMIVMVGIILAGFSGFLTTSVQDVNLKKQLKTQQALRQAKEALLSYAVDYLVDGNVHNMGALPCPDAKGTLLTEGNQDSTCGLLGVNSVGLFPYKAVSIGKIVDESGECLWYIVSGSYKNSPSNNLRNWDTLGQIKVVDENGIQKHDDNYPVAVIISPGGSLDQSRAPVNTLPSCNANFNREAYLEGGQLNYSTGAGTDWANIRDSIWTVLQPSKASVLGNNNYNDKVIAIYKNEIWDRVKKTKDLETAAGVNSNIKLLTQQLAECIKDYGNDEGGPDPTVNNPNYNLPYPASLYMSDYSNMADYKDQTTHLYGRIPQDISQTETYRDLISQDTHFVRNNSGNSYCEERVTDFNEVFWNHWKDHFYYVTAEDYRPVSTTGLGSKCGTAGSCLSINGKHEVAAIVFFANEASTSQDNRLLTGLTSNTDIWNQYLDGGNQTLYDGQDATNDFVITENDYAYCIVKVTDINGGTVLGIEEC